MTKLLMRGVKHQPKQTKTNGRKPQHSITSRHKFRKTYTWDISLTRRHTYAIAGSLKIAATSYLEKFSHEKHTLNHRCIYFFTFLALFNDHYFSVNVKITFRTNEKVRRNITYY